MTDTTQPPAQPVSVKATPTKAAMSEGFKLGGIAVLAAIADHFMHSEAAIIAVIAAGGVLMMGVWGVWVRLSNLKVMQWLVTLVPDEFAVLGNPK